jgi:quercetin dioxygenase-like cupin family protein
MIVQHLADHAKFSPEKMAKTDIARGETLLAGLNCFEPGQQHAAHAHSGQDKLYVVLEGDAEIQVGEETQLVSTGGGAFAPSGVMHSVRNRGEKRLIVLAVLAPPPTRS